MQSWMTIETLEWILFALSPVLAFGVAYVLYNAYCGSSGRERRHRADRRLNADYQMWREWIKARGGIQPVFCSRAFNKDEVCYAYEREAFSYEPLMPHMLDKTSVEDAPVFDTACGAPVGEGWSILDCFEGVNFVGKGFLFVTDRNLYLKGSREIKIPLGELQVVATSCSNFLVETKSMDRPLIFTEVNGQMLRDTVYMLLEKRTAPKFDVK